MSFWTTHPNSEELLKTLWLQGYTSAYILGAIGAAGLLTRNAVIGKAHRLGLPPHERAPTIHKHPTPNPEKKHHFRRWILPEQEPVMEHKGEPTGYYVSLYDAKDHQCRWVVGDATNLLYCGAPVEPDAELTYCPHHHKRMFQYGSQIRNY